MTVSVAVVGDIHGNLSALRGMLSTLEGRYSELVFVGDYVNRGPCSKEVIDTLIEISATQAGVFCVAGNHDQEFLDFLQGGSLVRLLRIGGAATVRSYLPKFEGPDLERRFRSSVPKRHQEFLQMLRPYYFREGFLVTHGPKTPREAEMHRFHTYGHRVQRDYQPHVGETFAAIDTGCGTLVDGRLTCMLWPSRSILQVDRGGHVIPRHTS